MTISSIALIHEKVNRNLPPDVYDVWLDPEAPPEVLTGRSRPYPSEVMEATTVATAVNGPGSDEPAAHGADLMLTPADHDGTGARLKLKGAG